GPDQADRGAFGEGAHRTHGAGCDADVHAARYHCLLGFAAALRVKKLETQSVPLENAGALADLGERGGPIASLPDRQFQTVFSVCGTCQRDGTQGRDFGESYIPCSHRFSSSRRSRSLMLQASSRLDARGSQCRLYGSSLCKSWHYSKRTMAATIVS